MRIVHARIDTEVQLLAAFFVAATGARAKPGGVDESRNTTAVSGRRGGGKAATLQQHSD